MSSTPEVAGEHSENDETQPDSRSERVIDRQRRAEVLKQRLAKRRAEEAKQRAKRLAELDSLLEEAESERYLAQRRLIEIEERAARHKELGQAVARKRLARGLKVQQPGTELPPVTPRPPRRPRPKSQQPAGELPAGDRTRVAAAQADQAAGSGESPEHPLDVQKPERDGSVRSKARVRKHLERQRQEEAEKLAREEAEKMQKQERKRKQAEAIKEQRAAAARRAAERMQREKAAREAAKAEEIKAENLAREKAKAYSSPEKIARLKAGQGGEPAESAIEANTLRPIEAPAEVAPPLGISEAAAQALFQELDRNRDGRVSYYELRMKMSKDGELEKLLGLKDAKKRGELMYRVNEVQKMLDANGDGYISQQEFVKLLMAPSGDVAAERGTRQSPRLSEDDLSFEDESSRFAQTVHALTDEDWKVEINILRPSGD